jgi:hypothetical protein
MTPRHTIVTKVLLGALLVACLPRFPDGERGVQCWTDRAADRTTCTRTALWCLEDAKDASEADECLSELERCAVASDLLAEQCERRTGCLAAQAACEDACGNEFEVSPGCISDCGIELELCAPWLDLDCERECQEPLYECLTTATHAFHEAACDREHLDCVLDCYDRAPQDGAAQGSCDPGRYTCDDDRITACVDGYDVERYECNEVCASLGSQSTGCNDGECSCLGQPTAGTVCERAASVICVCSAELDGIPCSADDTAQLVQQCEDGLGAFECYAEFIDDVPEVCELLFLGDLCTCPWTDDGECDEPEGTGICPEGTDPGDC